MGFLRFILVAVMPLSLGGCMTTLVTWNHARGNYTWPDAPKEQLPPLKRKPLFYGLLPLTVPFDALTAPIQAPLFVMWLTMPEPEPLPPEP